MGSARLTAKTTEAMRIEVTSQWGHCEGVGRSSRHRAALAVAAKAYDIVEVLRARGPKRGDNAGNASGNGNLDDGPVETLRGAQVKAKRTAVQLFDGCDKTGSNGVGDEDLDVKLVEEELV